MKKIVTISLTLLSALTLTACGSHSVHRTTVSKTTTSLSQKSRSTSVKGTNSNSNSTATNNSSSSQGDHSASAPQQGPQFPSSFQRTWYGYNTYNKSIDAITFTGNQSNDSQGDATTIHDPKERTTDDEEILSGNKQPTTPEENQKLNSWGVYSEVNLDNGEHWINIMGWYQSAGDGEFYRVANESVNGQQVPVLLDAGGAEIWIDEHYYTSKALAMQMKDTNFPGDRTREDEESSDNQSDDSSDSNDDSDTNDNDDNTSDNQSDDSSTDDNNESDSQQDSDSDSDSQTDDSSSDNQQDDNGNSVDTNNDTDDDNN